MSRPHPLYDHPDFREVGVPVATVWTSPEAPRPIDADAVADRPDMGRWTGAMDAEARLDLHGRSLTQLLLGEAVLVLEHHGEWSRVVALMQSSSSHARGYPGWVRTAHLDTHVHRWTGASAFVAVPFAPCTLETGEQLALSCGTGLWVDALREEDVAVLLPGNRRGTIPLRAVRLGHKLQQPTYGPDDLLATARQFLGTRYLWGGTSAWGLDCSGLVHLTLRSHAVPLPRDAFDQADAVRKVMPVDLDDVQPGDLYFFARPGQRVYHVGFATSPLRDDGARWMLHAPEGGGLIEDAPMADDRLAVLVSAGRLRKPNAGQVTTYHPDDIDEN
jgi:hypothetical protein